MLLGYIDESYVRGGRYWLGVALVPADKVPGLALDLRGAMAILPREHEPLCLNELHGHALFHGAKAFAPLRSMVDLRVRLYRRGLETLVRATAAIVFVGVDWAGCSRDPNARSLAFHRMRAVTSLLPLLDQQAARTGEHLLLIADEEETTRRDFVQAVREHKRRGLDGPGGCLILDNVLFVDSQDSPGVQCADLALFLHARLKDGRDTSPRAAAVNHRLYRVFEGCELVEVVHTGR